jgi:hypothetical protein
MFKAVVFNPILLYIYMSFNHIFLSYICLYITYTHTYTHTHIHKHTHTHTHTPAYIDAHGGQDVQSSGQHLESLHGTGASIFYILY